MFSVKQQTNAGDKIWPGVSHVWTESQNVQGVIDAVECLFEAGGNMRFDAGVGKQIIYVMNENGATVARYDFSYRGNGFDFREAARCGGIAQSGETPQSVAA